MTCEHRIQLISSAFSANHLPHNQRLCDATIQSEPHLFQFSGCDKYGFGEYDVFSVLANGTVYMTAKHIDIKKYLKAMNKEDPIVASRRLVMLLYAAHFIDNFNVQRSVKTSIENGIVRIYTEHYITVTDYVRELITLLHPNLAGRSVINSSAGIRPLAPSNHLRYIMDSVFRGLEGLEQHRIIHNSINSDKIIITARGVIKLTHFENSRYETKNGLRFVRYMCVNNDREYILESLSNYDSAHPLINTDIWSAGIVFFYLLCGRTRFVVSGTDEPAVNRMHLQGITKFLVGLKQYNPDDYGKLSALLCADAKQFVNEAMRLTVHDTRKASWLRQNCAFLQHTKVFLEQSRHSLRDFLQKRKCKPVDLFKPSHSSRNTSMAKFDSDSFYEVKPPYEPLDSEQGAFYRVDIDFQTEQNKVVYEAHIPLEERVDTFRLIYELLYTMPQTHIFEYDALDVLSVVNNTIDIAFDHMINDDGHFYRPEKHRDSIVCGSGAHCAVTVRVVLPTHEAENADLHQVASRSSSCSTFTSNLD